jgi:nucleolar protein 4
LIIRNLSFKCTPEILKKEFSKFGEVKETSMPRKCENGPYRGFGVIQFSRRVFAQKALEAMNEKKICGRTVAVDWCLPQAQYLLADGVPFNDVKGKIDEKFARLNSRFEKPINLDDETNADEEDQDMKCEDSSIRAGEPVKAADEGYSSKDSNLVCERDEDEVGEATTKSQVKRLIGASEGTTVFVRNVPFNCTDEDLGECFSSFGEIVYSKITCDRDSGRPKGTGFVCFANKDSADACIDQATKTNSVAFSMATLSGDGNSKVISSNAPAMSSLLQPELPSTLLDSPLVLCGRLLNVVRAVERDQANQLTAKEKLKRERRDNRNLYLLSEGYQGDIQERKSNLEKNAALYVSRTRVSLRKLPQDMNEKHIRLFALEAARHYVNYVVSKGDDHTFPTSDIAQPSDEIPTKELDWTSVASSIRILSYQAKIVRDKDRIGADGKPRSKCFGFVEFENHRAAIACVRLLTHPKSECTQQFYQNIRDCFKKDNLKSGKNTPTGKELEAISFQALPEILSEFAIENKQVVSMRSAKVERMQKLQREPSVGRSTSVQSRFRKPEEDVPPKTSANLKVGTYKERQKKYAKAKQAANRKKRFAK